MSKTFTKLFLAGAMLFGVNSAFAEKYKATMEFGGAASGASNDVDAEITKEDDGLYTISFIGFDVNIQLLGDYNQGSCNISKLQASEDNGLTLSETADSQFEIVGQSLNLKKFTATIDNDGNGSGSFTGTKSIGFMEASATCEFTLTKVVDIDTVVKKSLEFDDVPFYNMAVDLTKPNDTIKTNNDSTAAGVLLYEKKASFYMPDFEISVGQLSLKQRMLLENLAFATDETGNLTVSGKTNMYVNQYKMYVPAEANINVSKDGKVDGSINIVVDMYLYKYQIIVVFGQQAEGVVVETKTLEYNFDDATRVGIKSDSTFVFDSVLYYSNEGILIQNIHYSIVDQPMTLLISELDYLLLDVDLVPIYSAISIVKAKKAKAYITVNDEIVYLKDVDIDLDLITINSSNKAFGSLSIEDGGSATNVFIDPEGPFKGEGFSAITMHVDTTGNGLDGYTADSEFEIDGIYDYSDGIIKTVKLKDLDETRNKAIAMMGAKSFSTIVIATDKTGNTSELEVSCIATPAPVTIEEVLPEINDIRVVADSISGVANVEIDSFVVRYVAKNETTGQSAEVGSTAMQLYNSSSNISLPTTMMQMEPGHYTKLLVWENPLTGESNQMKIEIKVYESPTSYSSVANVASKTVSVIYKDGSLIVNGANDPNVSIVSMSGATVYNGKTGAINLHKGIYIVKVDGKAYKMVVK